MPIEIITVIITAALNILFWVIQRFFNRKSDAAALDKSEAETDNIDSGTIQNLVDGMSKLNDMYEGQMAKNEAFATENAGLRRRISELESSYNDIVEQNRILKKENEEMNIVLRELKSENEALRKLIVDNQMAQPEGNI